MKKIIVSVLLIICMCGCTKETLSKLPQPELSEGQRGQLGIDKNINESTIDFYLDREDSVYRDMRMLKDEEHMKILEETLTYQDLLKDLKLFHIHILHHYLDYQKKSEKDTLAKHYLE